MIVTSSLAASAVINRQGSVSATTNDRPRSSTFGIDIFKGNASGPCREPSIEIALDDAFVLNSTTKFCISTHGIPATCIGRRMIELPGVETPAQTYEATHGGLDTKPYQCDVIGYQKDGCPKDEGAEAQYHRTDATWSWDHETRVRDDIPGALWSVLSFQMSCKP